MDSIHFWMRCRGSGHLRFGARPCLCWPGVHCACSVGRPSQSTLCFLFLRLTSSRTTPFPVSAARSRAPLAFSFLRSAYAPLLLPSPAAFRGAAGLLLFLRPPREGWAERREAHQRTVAPAKRNHRASETRAVPGDGTAPVGAPPWRFTDRATTRHVSDSASDHAAPSRGRPHGQPFGSRGLPMAVAPRFRDATPRSASERLRRRPSRARMGINVA